MQVNLEYLQLDSRSFVTGEDRALSLLFGAASDESVEARVTVKHIAQRLATLFATLKVTGVRLQGHAKHQGRSHTELRHNLCQTF